MEKLAELKSAEAVVMGAIAVVGVEYDAQYQEGMTGRLKEMIERPGYRQWTRASSRST